MSYKLPVIIGLIALAVAALMLFAWQTSRGGTRGPLGECRTNVLVIASALDVYKKEHHTTLKSLEGLLPNYLVRLPTCPAVGKNTYVLMQDAQGEHFTVCCSSRQHDGRVCYPAYSTRMGLVK